MINFARFNLENVARYSYIRKLFSLKARSDASLIPVVHIFDYLCLFIYFRTLLGTKYYMLKNKYLLCSVILLYCVTL